MENYFILLELPFDPPAEDARQIDAAIEKKRNQWNRDLVNPVRKAKASEYLSRLDEIRRVMSDPAARSAEADKARRLKEEKREELRSRLSLYAAKGPSLSDKDLKQLLRLFGPFGFSGEEIRQAFEALGNNRKREFNPSSVLDKTQANNLRNFMRQLDMQDSALYEFLSLPPSASCAQLCEAANAIKRKILSKGDKTGRDNATQSLCGLCVVLFKDTQSKRRYDNYLNLTRYGGVNSALDELAISNQRRIDPRMKESLIDLAVRQYGLSVPDASIYINNYCAYMGYALPENRIVCGLCGTENPAGTTNCVKCGKPLMILCPSCGGENNNSARQCAKCGFDLSGMEKAAPLLREARRAYAERDLDRTEALLREAAGYWPNHPDISSLSNDVAAEREKAAETLRRVMRDIQARRFYAARVGLHQARADGVAVDDAAARRVTETLETLEERLPRLRALRGDEAYRLALELWNMVSDSQEVNDRLKALPPAPSPGVAVTYADGEATLSWQASPSAGDLQYRLVRKENSPPNSPEDGALIYEGTERSWTDRSLKENQLYHYAVYVLRTGGVSTAARLPNPAALVRRISHLSAISGDSSVTLNWERNPALVRARVWKCRGEELPRSDKDWESVPCDRQDSVVIRDLRNGERYWFAVSAEYAIQGAPYVSGRVYVSAAPQKPAKPLEKFSVRFTGEECQASWEPSEWDLILFLSKKKPGDELQGKISALSELLERYQRIDYRLTGAHECVFRLNAVGERYIIPGLIRSSNVILSAAVNLSFVPPVKDISFDLNAAGTELYINYTWPPKIKESLLLYRLDRYPDGPDDPAAVRIESGRRKYEADQGVLIPNPAEGVYYVAVFSCLDSGGERYYGDGVRAQFSNEPQREVVYALKYKKPGFLNKSCTLSVTVNAPDFRVFPAFEIVSKLRSVPLNRKDGEVVASVTRETEINGAWTFHFPLPSPLRPGARLKLFFLDDRKYRSFKPLCKSGNTV